MEIFVGIVESRADPLKLGRCKCRIVGLHTPDKTALPTDDLPWAVCLQPISSASISGIGFSPTGLVEGSSVIIVFTDEDKQQPVMIGSFSGIPQDAGEFAVDDETLNIVDDDGLIEDKPVDSESNMQMPSAYKLSETGINIIKQFESKKLKAYLDTNGKYSIGYGIQTYNGSPVYAGQVITDAEAESSFYRWVEEAAAPDVVKRIKVPVTQSMFDALVSVAYNMGGPKFGATTIVSYTNQSKYEEAAAQFDTYTTAVVNNVSKKLPGLVTRRSKEKARYLEDGINGVAKTSLDSEKTAVSLQNQTDNRGFKDPHGKYPTYKFEPDTNRLARGERIETTIVRKKELTLEKNVKTCGTIWSQSPVPYNTTYPYNYVYQSESGHVMEFDDTVNSERIHLYHKSGTFFEIDANGTEVKKIVGDGYEILERDSYIYIKGDKNITIDGTSSVQVNNALNVDVIGNTTVNIHNNCDVNVSGDMNTSVRGSYKVKADSIYFESNTLNIKSTSISQESAITNIDVGHKTETINGDCSIRYEGDLHTHIGADTYNRHDSGIDYSCPSDPSRSSSVDCGNVDEASYTPSTNLTTPTATVSPVDVDKSSLRVITRGTELLSHYDTPEEGTEEEIVVYTQKLESKGIVVDPVDETAEKEKVTPVANNKQPTKNNCELIYATDKFQGNFQLSKHFTVNALTLNNKHKLRPQMGITVQEIVCNMKGLAENCLDVIKETYPNMLITSGFRPFGYPKQSAKRSQHYFGQAADIQLNGFSKSQHYEAIQNIQKLVPYDQLIMEYSGSHGVWIHISFKYEGNRKQHLTMKNHRRVGEFGVFKLID